MYALSKYIGKEQVHGALKQLLIKHDTGKPPLPTTLDLYSELKVITPDTLQYLLHDLFDVNTFCDLKTDPVTARQTKDGTWQARKRKGVGQGSLPAEAPNPYRSINNHCNGTKQTNTSCY